VVAGAYDAIPADEALTRGKAAAAKALELDDGLASAHYALATAHAWYDWDWQGADAFPALLRECGAAYRESGSLVVAARCYAQSGDAGQALALLDACCLKHCSSLVNVLVEPDFDVLRPEPRFRQFLRKVDPGAVATDR
jgi:hypothetical protein